MSKVAVIGAKGFVGSAFVEFLSAGGKHEVVGITRVNYDAHRRSHFEVVVDCSGNSRKYLADEAPVEEFDRSVSQRLRTLHDFGASLHVHVSSVDVYNDLTSPLTTKEDVTIDPARASRYGLHKWIAEQLVRRYAPRWLIVRLAGMVGPGLRKNPVYDILHNEPLRIHPESRYQFLSTSDAARLTWMLVQAGRSQEVFNVCGEGLIAPCEIAHMAGRSPDLSLLDHAAEPRLVDVNIGKLCTLTDIPRTREVVRKFLEARATRPGA